MLEKTVFKNIYIYIRQLQMYTYVEKLVESEKTFHLDKRVGKYSIYSCLWMKMGQ